MTGEWAVGAGPPPGPPPPGPRVGPPPVGPPPPGRVGFRVEGDPVSQGSMAFYGGGRVAHGRPAHARALAVWRAAVGEAGRAAMVAAGSGLLEGAVGVEVVFYVERPLVHFSGRRRSHPVRADAPTLNASKPDLDKLVRALLDSLTAVVWVDDGQVAQVTATKRYAAPDPLGARVAVWALAEGTAADPAVVTLDVGEGAR